jgi:hypothetical protein
MDRSPPKEWSRRANGLLARDYHGKKANTGEVEFRLGQMAALLQNPTLRALTQTS